VFGDSDRNGRVVQEITAGLTRQIEAGQYKLRHRTYGPTRGSYGGFCQSDSLIDCNQCREALMNTTTEKAQIQVTRSSAA
jgi:hypothetical protein